MKLKKIYELIIQEGIQADPPKYRFLSAPR